MGILNVTPDSFSRPGHQNISTEEEQNRVIPIIQRLSAETDTIKSHRDKKYTTDLSSIIYEADKASRLCFNCNAKDN